MYQEELGALVEPFLGKRFSKVIVSAVETGRRGLDAGELLAFVAVLGRPLEWFFLPGHRADTVELPSGRLLDAKELKAIVEGPQPGEGESFIELPEGRTVLLHGDERYDAAPDLEAQMGELQRRWDVLSKRLDDLALRPPMKEK